MSDSPEYLNSASRFFKHASEKIDHGQLFILAGVTESRIHEVGKIPAVADLLH